MIRHSRLLVVTALTAISAPSFAQQRPTAVPGEVIVQPAMGYTVEEVIAAHAVLDGKPTGLHQAALLSAHMRAYLLAFDRATDHTALLRSLRAHRSVSAAQPNHYISWRNGPDDTQFGSQWHHHNTGQSGGTEGADVRSLEAWEITTGGLTPLGDTIVVCVVDDGTRFTHPDLAPTLWVNHHEIPGNGIDDDGNGYVDDYYGWNAANGNDNVGNGSHGVSVGGMMGAKGNNGAGVAGVNWDLRIMNVVNGSIGSGNNPNEANVIAAYSYPLAMRKLYHETGGERGAFVVATNSSWGIDYGNAANAPLWCAFYDTLGAYGILSAAATANAQIDVDVSSDLPTGCQSDYLISVTATNHNDVRTFSAYGATTIELGAPGDNVLTTSGASGYVSTSGTSFASPMVAGAIALLYSVPCPSLTAIAHAEPALAAQLIRQYILEGAQPVPDLQGYTITGARLDLRGAIDRLLEDCTDGGCIAPVGVSISALADTGVSISWTNLPAVLSADLQLWSPGSDTITFEGVTSPLAIHGLDACTHYSVRLRAHCEGDSSAWTSPRTVKTDGCCEAPATLSISAIGHEGAQAAWPSVLAAQSYVLQWREAGAAEWAEVAGLQLSSFAITGLQPCTAYEAQVAVVCADSITGFTAAAPFTTLGCGACLDNSYCPSDGDSDMEWIANVTIGSFSHSSSGAGYEDNTHLTIDMHRGSEYPVSFTPGYSGTNYREHFRLWVDLNGNGQFSGNELLFDDPVGSMTTVTGVIAIPLSAPMGITRMRVSMAFGSQFFGDYPQGPCETGHDGEVEDYCVNILDSVASVPGISGIAALTVYPVPSSDRIAVRLPANSGPVSHFTVTDMSGRQVLRQQAEPSGSEQRISISHLAPGLYMLEAAGAMGITGRARFIRQ